MSYVRPIVQVYQHVDTLTTAAAQMRLIPCIVGPCYHCLDVEDDPVLTSVGLLTVSGNDDVAIPNNKSGAVPEVSSIRVKYAGGHATLPAKDCEGVEDYCNLTFTEANFPGMLTVGSLVTVRKEVDDDPITYETVIENVKVTAIDRETFTVTVNKEVIVGGSDVLSVIGYLPLVDFYVVYDADTTSFVFENGSDPLLNEDGTYLVNGLEKSITLKKGEATIVSYDSVTKTLDINGLLATMDTVDYPIAKAIAYVGYRSLRTDLTDVHTIEDSGTLEGTFGKCNSDNPLGLGVTLAFANTSGKVPIKFVGVGSNDIEGYTAAMDRLALEENVYAVVPLSQDVGIIGIFKVQAEAMSTPDSGQWRLCLANTELPLTAMLSTGSCSIKLNNTARTLVYSDDGNFLTNNIKAGDIITLHLTSDETYDYVIADVYTEDLLEVVATSPIAVNFLTDGTLYTFFINSELDKPRQALQIKKISEAYGSSRTVNVFPASCTVDNEVVPGYFLGCAIAGMIGGLPSQVGLTRIGLGGITAVSGAGDYFNAAQLDIIASGGTCIVYQSNPLALPVIRHQLTTDMSAIEYREISFIKNFDYVSYLCKDTLDQYIGRYNITPITLSMLQTTLASLLESLRLATIPKYGAPILGYTIYSVAQSETNRGRVEINVGVRFPYVLNEIGLYLHSE